MCQNVVSTWDASGSEFEHDTWQTLRGKSIASVRIESPLQYPFLHSHWFVCKMKNPPPPPWVLFNHTSPWQPKHVAWFKQRGGRELLYTSVPLIHPTFIVDPLYVYYHNGVVKTLSYSYLVLSSLLPLWVGVETRFTYLGNHSMANRCYITQKAY